MQFFSKPVERRGIGQWEAATGRYVPKGGGSYSRLPIVDDEDIPRYWGFVGMDESMTPNTPDLPSLYGYLSGGVYIPEGPAGEYIQQLISLSHKWLKAEEAGEHH